MAKSPSSNGVSGVIAPRASAAPPAPPYADIDVLRSADGITAIISQRRSSGVLTFSIFKEFERDGVIEKTAFITEQLVDSYLAMAEMVKERITKLREMATLPAMIPSNQLGK